APPSLECVGVALQVLLDRTRGNAGSDQLCLTLDGRRRRRGPGDVDLRQPAERGDDGKQSAPLALGQGLLISRIVRAEQTLCEVTQVLRAHDNDAVRWKAGCGVVEIG